MTRRDVAEASADLVGLAVMAFLLLVLLSAFV